MAILLAVPSMTSTAAATDDLAGKPVVLRYWTPNYPPEQEISRILGKDMEKLGIQLEIKSTGYDVWVADIIRKDSPFHLVLCTWGSSPARLDPNHFLSELFVSERAAPGGKNYGNYSSPEYDALVVGQQKEMDRMKRQTLVRKAQELLHRDNAFYVCYFKAYFQAYNSDRIEGAVPVMASGVGFPYIPLTYLNAKPKTSKTEITVVNIHDINSINPFFSPDVEDEWWLRLIYDTLIKRDKDLSLIPWAAESWKVVNATTIDVVVRDGMTFHDGQPVTAEDLKFTIDYSKKWEFPNQSRIWKNIKSAEIVGERTVRFNLEAPYSPFIETIMPYMIIAPKHIWEKIPDTVSVDKPIDWTNPHPIGSGPYKFDVWQKGEYFHLTRHADHFNAPKFDGLYYKINPTMEGIMAMLEKGDADIVAWNLDAEQAKRLDALPHLTAINTPSIGMTELRPNFKLKPFDDPKFRQAFKHAVNRRLMLDINYGGNGIVSADTPIAKTISFWSNHDLKPAKYSLDEARKILKSAGYTWDKKGHLLHPK